MKIDKERFEDIDEENPDNRSYCYAGWLYRFRSDGLELLVRQYEDESTEASFLNYRRKERGWRSWKMFNKIPYGLPLFRDAIGHLRITEGVRQFKILLPKPNPYRPVRLYMVRLFDLLKIRTSVLIARSKQRRSD